MRIALVLLLTAACLAWVLWGLNPSHIVQALREVRWQWMVPMVLLQITVVHGLRTRRLQVLLDVPVRFGALFSINAVGNLAINVVPFRLGELVRPYLLMEQQKVPLGAAFAAIFVARLLDMTMLLALLTGVGLVVSLPPQGLVVGGVDVVAVGQRTGGVVTVGGLGFIAALVLVGEPVVQLVERLLPAHPVVERGLGFLRAFQRGFAGLVRQPLRFAEALLHSVLAWAATVVVVLTCMLAFDGIPHRLDVAATIWATTITGTIVVPTPGFVGAYEAFCLAALLLWDVPKAVGSTFAVVLHAGQLASTILLGSIFLLREGLSLRQIVASSQEVLQKEEIPLP